MFDDETRGRYFSRKKYVPEPLPRFADSRSRLPSPVADGNPEFVAAYWRAWEIAFDHLLAPPPGSPLVSNFLDEAFNECIFQWDTIFMVMFGRYMHDVFPAVGSLDNFYSRQHDDGVIWRVLTEAEGADHEWAAGNMKINPPLFSWAEVESFRITGDRTRLELVVPVLEKYLEWLEANRVCAGTPHRLYWTNGLASGMDNTPRDEGRPGGNGSGDESGWVDMSCQMVIQYENLALMCDELDRGGRAAELRRRAEDISRRVNEWCWNEADGLYYDVTPQGEQTRWKTVACFWPLLAGIAGPVRAGRLAANLKDPNSFWREVPFPSLAADQPHYDPKGRYWRGGVWAPTNYMIVKGLEHCGLEDFAAEAAGKYLAGLCAVLKKTNTFWELYAPDSAEPGTIVDGRSVCRKDFVGWTGCGPIALFIENVLGFRVDGSNRRLRWRLTRTDRHGIERMKVGDVGVSAVAGARRSRGAAAGINVRNDGAFELVVLNGRRETRRTLAPGEHYLLIEGSDGD